MRLVSVRVCVGGVCVFVSVCGCVCVVLPSSIADLGICEFVSCLLILQNGAVSEEGLRENAPPSE